MDKTIEERAKAYIHKAEGSFWSSYDYAELDAYVQGATEQKAIDDEELGKALLYCTNKTAERVKREMIEDACCILLDMALTKREEYKTYKDVITAFRKKLED